MRSNHPRVLAACYRAPYLALAITSGTELLMVERLRLPRNARSMMGRRIKEQARAYRAHLISVEPGLRRATYGLEPTRITTTLSQAKARLTGNEHCTHRALCDHLAHAVPRVRRLVTVLRTGRVKTSEKWKLVVVFAVALGLAAERLTQ